MNAGSPCSIAESRRSIDWLDDIATWTCSQSMVCVWSVGRILVIPEVGFPCGWCVACCQCANTSAMRVVGVGEGGMVILSLMLWMEDHFWGWVSPVGCLDRV